jgi:hypothetical protein
MRVDFSSLSNVNHLFCYKPDVTLHLVHVNARLCTCVLRDISTMPKRPEDPPWPGLDVNDVLI